MTRKCIHCVKENSRPGRMRKKVTARPRRAAEPSRYVQMR
jgi:hypothetical protein